MSKKNDNEVTKNPTHSESLRELAAREREDAERLRKRSELPIEVLLMQHTTKQFLEDAKEAKNRQAEFHDNKADIVAVKTPSSAVKKALKDDGWNIAGKISNNKNRMY